MDKDVLWATTIVDQKAKLDKQEQKLRTCAQKLGILIVDDTKDRREMNNKSLNETFANIQVEQWVRKTSSELRHDIVHLGGADNITELRLKKKIEAAKLTNLSSIHVASVDCEKFLEAATNGDLKVVDKLLQDGVDPNTADEFRKSALHRAAFEGHVKIVDTLLDKGAIIDFQDRLACTAVHWASRGGSLDALKLLQSSGADLNVKDKLLSTPLHVATRTGNSEIVEHLLSSGVQINATDREGDTALHDAVRLNRYKIVKSSLLAGADIKIKNAEGVTAKEQVKMWQCDTKEMFDELEQME